MTAKRPNLALVREGNPGHRALGRFDGGLSLDPVRPVEPDWRDWFPVVRPPTVKQLQRRWPLELIEGSLTHIEHDGKRKALARARRDWMIATERDTKIRSRDENRRARHVARETWRRVVDVLDAVGMLTRLDVDVLTDHAVCVARMDQCERDISTRGLWTQGERGAVKNPATTALNQLRTQFRWTAAQLGLTPVARDALNPSAPADDDDNPFS